MKRKTALITGITGQDGAYLADFLIKKKYRVFGTYRRISTPNFWRLFYLGIENDVKMIPADLIDGPSLTEAIKISNPNEIYNLAAQSYVGSSFEQPITSGEFSGLSVTRILEGIRTINPEIKFYQASSSEMFGNSKNPLQNETTGFFPKSPYAVSKLYGFWTTKLYREGYDMFTVNGILFNHESPIRGLEFVTRKITNAAARIKLGIDNKLVLGYLESTRDWGYAPEYVEGMWKMMQLKKPDDFVLATGESHTIRECVKIVFDYLDLDWKKYVKQDKKYYRVIEVDNLKGDSKKAQKKLGWKPKVKFSKLLKIMVDEDLERWKLWKKGETFPWDALNYINNAKTFFRKNDKKITK